MATETTDNTSKNLYAALLAAQKAMGSVEKDARNNYSNYDYASAEAMVDAARRCLQNAGLVGDRESFSYKMDEVSVGESNYPSATVTCNMVLVHAETGECIRPTITFPAIARKGTPIDKAVAAALTSALAYWLRDILLIPRGDFGAVEQHDDTDYGGFSAEDAFSKCASKLSQRTGDEKASAAAVRGWMENFADCDDRPNKDDFAALWQLIGRGEMDAHVKGEEDGLLDVARGNSNGNGKAK